MDFIIQEKERLFHIEKSDLYKKLGEGVHTVEFVYLDNKSILQFVEAKTTCPNANNKNESREKQQKYEEYYQELTKKYEDSLGFLNSILMGIHQDIGIGKEISAIQSYKNIRIRLFLVIKNAEEAWLGGSKAELEQRLLSLRKIWKLDIQVLNEELAVKKGMIREING